MGSIPGGGCVGVAVAAGPGDAMALKGVGVAVAVGAAEGVGVSSSDEPQARLTSNPTAKLAPKIALRLIRFLISIHPPALTYECLSSIPVCLRPPG